MKKKTFSLSKITIIILSIVFITYLAFSFSFAKKTDKDQAIQNKPLTGSFRKGPYLIYPGHPNQMKILWQLTANDTCAIEWGLDTTYSIGNSSTVEYGSDHQHSFNIDNLQPGLLYYYRVNNDEYIKSGSFRSAPDSTSTAVKFIVYGDTRSNPAAHDQVASRIINTYTNDSAYQTILISVGDLVNNGDLEADWDGQFFASAYTNIQRMLANFPYSSSMGNHEDAGLLFNKYFPYPFVSNRYWSFDYGPAHFAIIDQYSAYGSGSPQLLWLANDLASTTRPWKFIVLHEPGWSAGNHSNNVNVQNLIQPLCLQYGVSIVFGGHNHNYARALVNGVQHITTGGGGAPLYQPNPSYPYIVASSMSYHYCKVEIAENHLYFAAVNSNGATIDSFAVGPRCTYVPGDVNGNGMFNGLDVTYSVNYFRGIGDPPPYSCECSAGQTWYVAGDVNNSCSFNGLDITYIVNYFKGGAIPIPCHDCPP